MTRNEALKAKAAAAIARAEEHVMKAPTMLSSAKLCLSDAKVLFSAESYEAATKRALKSLSYSVGIFHPDYRKLKDD